MCFLIVNENRTQYVQISVQTLAKLKVTVLIVWRKYCVSKFRFKKLTNLKIEFEIIF